MATFLFCVVFELAEGSRFLWPATIGRNDKEVFELNAFDIDIRIRDEGKPDPVAMLVPHEIGRPEL